MVQRRDPDMGHADTAGGFAMTIVDLVTFGPILNQLYHLEQELAEQRRYTEDLCSSLHLAVQRQEDTAQLLIALRSSLRTCADEHGRARLAAGDLHQRSAG